MKNLSDLLDRAMQIAVAAHAGDRGKAGLPYVLHPFRIMLQMPSLETMIIAALHDVVEDSEWTIDDLRKEGFPENILEAVDCLTRVPEESYEIYLERVQKNSLAVPVKLGDLRDNMDMKRLKKLTPNDLARLQKYHQAYQLLKPLQEKAS